MATEIAFHKRQYGAAEIKAEKQHLNPGSAPSGPGDLRQAPWVIDTLVSGGKLHWSPGIVLAQTCSRGITELPDAQGKTELSLTFHLQDWAGWTPRFLSPAPRLLRTPHAHKHRHVYFHTTHTPTNTCVHTYRPHTHACTCTNTCVHSYRPHTHTHACTCTNTCVHSYRPHTHTHACTCTNTCVHSYRPHTHTHEGTHAQHTRTRMHTLQKPSD